ncbi:zinc transporter ZIP10 [Protopterus annectens]|uniref:zinc transporter ZIP10 n=1 Tax=Protopterus annectens TaxID=7888 RepID=UPI001CFA8E67|nr:zinc transporter ZIP10 [Protopterus annectens]
MKVHVHTKFCFVCLLTVVLHHCSHCHENGHKHGPDEDNHLHDHSDHQISVEPYLTHNDLSSDQTVFFASLAENEQRHFIEQIFKRYGKNGRLSFNGLELLLKNIGLGTIKVVEIEHEDIGHDHMSHLDLLEVQEGRHSHVHSHAHTDNQTLDNTHSVSSSCSHQKHSPEGSLEKVTAHNSHNHTRTSDHFHNNQDDHHHHHHHHHQNQHHNSTVPTFNVSSNHSEHGEASSERETIFRQERKKKKHRNKHKGNKRIPASTEPSKIPDVLHLNDHDNIYEHSHDPVDDGIEGHNSGFVDMETHSRVIQLPTEKNIHNHNAEMDMHHNHKREVPVIQNSFVTIADSSAHDHEEEHSECLNVTQLLQFYGFSSSPSISQQQFTYLCPALLYQIDSRVCIRHESEVNIKNPEAGPGITAWVWGIVSITIISLLSLVGVILIPIIEQGCFKFMLTFLVALAVGTLSGDALLHLLPHSQGGHDHSHASGHEEDENLLTKHNAMWKGLMALGGIYLLFIIEHCISMFKRWRERKVKKKWIRIKQQGEGSAIGRKLSDHRLNRVSDADWLHLKPLAGPDDSALSDDKHNTTEMTVLDGQPKSPSSKSYSLEAENISQQPVKNSHSADDLHEEKENLDSYRGGKVISRNPKHHRRHSHHSHGHCHSAKDMKDTGIASIAWMVIMGDGMHNFSDGLAIGAAFSAGLTGGISTSVAVFCHELPHELGDFAVLLKAGMTVRQAIVYNLLSAMMAYVGMLIGTAVGQYTSNITLWIFAITAGMFLYVALVDMLPEMLHGDEDEGRCQMGHFVLQNFGVLLGFSIMLLIAIYEDRILINI